MEISISDEVEVPCVDRTYVCNLELHKNKGRGFVRVELV